MGLYGPHGHLEGRTVGGLCLQRARGFCGSLCSRTVGVSLCWSSLEFTFTGRHLNLTGLAHLHCFFGLSTLTSHKQCKIQTQNCGPGRPLLTKPQKQLFPLPRNLAKTHDLSWHNFLCLSFLVLLWVGVEPVLGFSFTQGFSLWILHLTQSYSEPDLPIHTGINGHGPGPQKGSQTSGFWWLPFFFFFLSISFLFLWTQLCIQNECVLLSSI